MPCRRANWCAARGLAPIAELTVVVLTPAPERTPASDGAAVRQTRRHCGEAKFRAHRRRCSNSVARTRAELTLIVSTPAERSSVTPYEAGVQTSGDDADPRSAGRWSDG